MQRAIKLLYRLGLAPRTFLVLKRGVLTAALVLAVGGVANAATLYAGPLSFFFEGQARCFVVNVSTMPRAITLTLLSSSGGEIDDKTCSSVAPGGSCFLDSGSGGNYCRIEVAGGKGLVPQAVVWG
jgi:hypothetical protein